MDPHRGLKQTFSLRPFGRCFFNGLFFVVTGGDSPHLYPRNKYVIDGVFGQLGPDTLYTHGKFLRLKKSIMAVLTRLELAASGVTGRRYNQLNYSTLWSDITPGSPEIFYVPIALTGKLSILCSLFNISRCC